MHKMQKKKTTGRPKRGGNYVRIHFALPEELYIRLKNSAEKNSRSITAELIHLLRFIK